MEEPGDMVYKKHIQYYLIFPVLTLSVLLSACGGVKTTSYFQPTKEKLSAFQAVQFEQFDTEIVDFPKEALSKIPAESAALLATKGKFQEVEFGPIANIAPEDTIVVLGEVTEYRPSSDISYEGGGVKFGEVSVTVRIALVNKANGNEISTGEVNGFSSLGFIARDIYGSLAQEIVKYIEEGY